MNKNHMFLNIYLIILFFNLYNNKIIINVTPGILNKNNEWVHVKVEGVPDPQHNDWIAVFSPSTFAFNHSIPIKFKYANSSEDYIKYGKSIYKFNLINLRSDYIFVLFRKQNNQKILYKSIIDNNQFILAKSNIISFKNPNEPLQGHLSLTNKSNEMRIMWSSGGEKNEKQYVKWGTKSKTYSFIKEAITYTYTREQMCGAPANSKSHWRDPGLLHTAIMGQILPRQKIFYIYGNDLYGWSEEQSFISAPLDMETNFSFIAYGDMGKSEIDGSTDHWDRQKASINTTKNIIKRLNEIDFVLHIGDISYAVGDSSEWDEFMNQITPIAQKVPYMTCIGNHERDFPNSGSLYDGKDSGGECGIPYQSRFILPNQNEPTDQSWYSFDYGSIHFIFMSTEHDFRVQSSQYNWIQKDLSSVNRKKTPWIIFSGHRPMYVDSTGNESDWGDLPVSKSLRQHIEPLLIKYKVNLCLWGHHHSYQRTCPIYKEECQQGNAPVHVIIGMAGFELSTNIHSKKPRWIEHIDIKHFGYTIIHVNPKFLHLQFFSNTNNTLKDEFYLTNYFY